MAGSFGVYPVNGYQEKKGSHYVCADDYFIGKIPERVTEPVTDGFPFFRGAITLKQEFFFESNDVLLQLNGTYQSAKVWVNGQLAGKLLLDKELDISEYAKAGKNEITIRFLISNRNLLGAHTTPEYVEERGARPLVRCFG